MMGSRFIFSTKAKLGVNVVQLKHKGLWLSGGDTKKIVDMVARARAMLSSTIAVLSSGGSTACNTHANTYFLGIPTKDEWTTLSARLELIYGGLSSDVTLKLGADGDYGYIMKHSVEGGGWSREGHTIHISKKRILKDEALGVITLIHEASHKYADFLDHGDAGYRESDDSGWWEPGLTKADALNNADSVAYFVYRVGESMHR